MIRMPEWFRTASCVSPERRLEWYPPYLAMRIKVVALAPDWRSLCLRLPLNAYNRNPGGSMFGGAIASLADPVAALSCNRVFPGHRVWTRALHLDFRREGRTDLELRFAMSPEAEQDIRSELQRKGRATPSFEFGFYDAGNHLCVQVNNTVALRPAGTTPRSRGDRTEVKTI